MSAARIRSSAAAGGHAEELPTDAPALGRSRSGWPLDQAPVNVSYWVEAEKIPPEGVEIEGREGEWFDLRPTPSPTNISDAASVSRESKFLREAKQEILSTAVGIARLRFRTGDIQGASDALDRAVDECHRAHFDACIADGWPESNVERFLGPRDEEVERVRI